ncbi:hypothetical protein D3C84_1129750 [compost metagenome]
MRNIPKAETSRLCNRTYHPDIVRCIGITPQQNLRLCLTIDHTQLICNIARTNLWPLAYIRV